MEATLLWEKKKSIELGVGRTTVKNKRKKGKNIEDSAVRLLSQSVSSSSCSDFKKLKLEP